MHRSGTLSVAMLLLITALFCRALWAAEQSTHAASQIIAPAVQAIEHGHYHDSLLGHFHPEDIGLSDGAHLLLHVMGAVEHQMASGLSAPLTPRVGVPPPPYLNPIPSEPPLAGPYRPPRA